MATMGNYCKAYPVERFRAYPGWEEKVPPLAYEDESSDDAEASANGPAAAAANDAAKDAPAEAADGDDSDDSVGYYFLQEDYTVTAGIFLDEAIAFDAVTDEWKQFCTSVLEFEVPPYEFVHPQPSDAASPQDASAQS
jgi:hypothetical protein